MYSKIVAELERIQLEQEIRILFACESGSRAWGFASPDSDYDVRFVYAHPVEWYLSIDDKRDVIELNLPGDLDVAGWELRKTLRLARRSNPPLHEWLQSPIFYMKDAEAFAGFDAATRTCYSPERCYLHYFHMAVGNHKDYLKGEEVWTKKYLYVLRPLLACMWIERWPGVPVPMEFDRLRRAVIEDVDVHNSINDLLILKAQSAELGTGPRIPAISDFIESQLARIDSRQIQPGPEPPHEALDLYFREAVGFLSPAHVGQK